MRTAILKYYALAVCIFAFVLLAVCSGLGLYSSYRLIAPYPVSLEKFEYSDINSFVLFGIKEENIPIFKKVTPEKFSADKEYYFNIIRDDQKKEIPRIIIITLIYSLLYSLLFVIHYNLLKRIKRFGF